MTPANPSFSTAPGPRRSWSRRPGCRRRAAEAGPEAVRRVELLRLRFEANLPIRAIAELWGIDAARLHHAYALARQEFRAALLAVVAFHQPGTPVEIEQEAAWLLKATFLNRHDLPRDHRVRDCR